MTLQLEKHQRPEKVEPEKEKKVGSEGTVTLGKAQLCTEVKMGCWFGGGFVIRKWRVRWSWEETLRVRREAENLVGTKG